MQVNIPDIREKGKSRYIKALFVPMLVILLAFGGYGVVKLIKIEKERVLVSIEYQNITPVVGTTTPLNLRGVPSTRGGVVSKTSTYVASRGGKSYYLPSCNGAKRLSEKKKIWFDTKVEAEKFGYKPAKNCKGM